MTTTAIIPIADTEIVRASSTDDVLAQLAVFLRINVSAGDASENTIKAYQLHIGQFALWCWDSGIDPGQASELDLARYRRHLVTEDYERSTIAVKLSAVRRFFEAAIWHGLRADNPAEGLKPPRQHTTRRDKLLERYLSREAVLALLDAPPLGTVGGVRDRAMMGLMYYHGLRVSEICHLTLDDLHRDVEPPSLHIVKAKGGKDRVVLLVEKSLSRLDLWLEVRPQIVNQTSASAVFLSLSNNSQGEPIKAPGARWAVQRWLKETTLYRAGFGPHVLRHCHGSHALAQGADLYVLSVEMGHASTDTTGVYLHVVDAVRQNPAGFL